MYRSANIKSSLLRRIICYLILPIMLILLLLSLYVLNFVFKNSLGYRENIARQVSNSYNQMIEITNYSSSMLMLDTEVLDALFLLHNSRDPYKIYKARDLIISKISMAETSVLNPVHGKIAILTESGDLLSTAGIDKPKQLLENTEWYRLIRSNGRKSTFSPDIRELFSNLSLSAPIQEKNALYIGRTIESYSGQYLGILAIRLEDAQIWDQYISKENQNAGVFCLADFNNQILLQSNAAYQISEIFNSVKQPSVSQYGITSSGHYYIYLPLKDSGNRLFYIEPVSSILGSTLLLLIMIILILITAAVLNIRAIVWISRQIAAPILYLADNIRNTQNGLEKIQPLPSCFEEISTFIEGYNHACEKNTQLIIQTREEAVLRERAYYDVLTSRITPHFLYNTIHSIKYMAEHNGDQSVADILSDFGSLLRSVYSMKSDITTIGNELQMLEPYVKIMQLRFGDSFQYIDIISSELYCYEIPVFTLQPLVENAIYHGVKDLEAGQIIISAIEEHTSIIISVFNNGKVEDHDSIQKILNRTDTAKMNGMGLSNVNSRIHLLYGESYGLEYNPYNLNGFEMLIHLPKIRRTL